MNPVTVEMLRADWDDNPELTPEQYEALKALPDDELQDMLDLRFRSWESYWFHMLDTLRGETTDSLLNQLAIQEKSP